MNNTYTALQYLDITIVFMVGLILGVGLGVWAAHRDRYKREWRGANIDHHRTWQKCE